MNIDLSEEQKWEEDFINIASHELRTPITSIKGYAQILQRKLSKKGDNEATEYLIKMDEQLNKLTYLIRDLLDVSKIQTGNFEREKELVNFDDLVDEIIEDIKPFTEENIIQKKGKASGKIVADRFQISQVMVNFITNAIKYASKNKKIVIHLKRQADNVILGVQDFGTGIAKQNQKKIFKRFYKINGRNETKFPGLGIGLYIASEIIKSHNGKIWVESTLGKGSTFYFSLPVKK